MLTLNDCNERLAILLETAHSTNVDLLDGASRISKVTEALNTARSHVAELHQAVEQYEREARFEQEAMRSAKSPQAFLTAGDAKSRDEQFQVLLTRIRDENKAEYDAMYSEQYKSWRELERSIEQEENNLTSLQTRHDALVVSAKLLMKRLDAAGQLVAALTVTAQLDLTMTAQLNKKESAQ